MNKFVTNQKLLLTVGLLFSISVSATTLSNRTNGRRSLQPSNIIIEFTRTNGANQSFQLEPGFFLTVPNDIKEISLMTAYRSPDPKDLS